MNKCSNDDFCNIDNFYFSLSTVSDGKQKSKLKKKKQKTGIKSYHVTSIM